MKDVNSTFHNHCNPRPFALLHFSANCFEQPLYVPPRDVGWHRAGKDLLE